MDVDPAQIPMTLMAPAMEAGQPPAPPDGVPPVGQLVRVNLSGSDSTVLYRVTDVRPDGIARWTWTMEPVTDEASG